MSVDPTALAFIDTVRRTLREEYLPKIERALSTLSEDDVWWRPNAASNSVGNLIMHLAGNIRQWIVSGVGETPDTRTRAAEFAADSSHSKAELLAQLRATLAEVDDVLAATDPAGLHEPRHIQGTDTTVFGAIFHATEHFSGHVGQILYIAKLRTATDLDLYDVTDDGVARFRKT